MKANNLFTQKKKKLQIPSGVHLDTWDLTKIKISVWLSVIFRPTSRIPLDGVVCIGMYQSERCSDMTVLASGLIVEIRRQNLDKEDKGSMEKSLLVEKDGCSRQRGKMID